MDKFHSLAIISPFFVTLFWLITISISSYQKRNHFKIPLLLFLFDSLIGLLISSSFYDGSYNLFRRIYVPAVFFSLSMFPLFYLYIFSMTSERRLNSKDYFRHLLVPGINTLFALVFLYVFFNANERIVWVEEHLTRKIQAEGKFLAAFYMDKIFRMIFLALAIVYYILTEKRIRRHRKALNNYFSNIEGADIQWFTIYRIVFLFTLIAAFLYFTADRWVNLEYRFLPAASHFLLAIFFWVVGYYGQKQALIFPLQLEDEPQPIENSKTISEFQMEELRLKLEKAMDKEKLFTHSEITLPQLSRHLGTNRTYLSKLFNTHYQSNFNVYINGKRIEHAVTLLDDLSRDININDLWSACGFNSISSFYRAFNTIEGMSPLAYRKKKIEESRHS